MAGFFCTSCIFFIFNLILCLIYLQYTVHADPTISISTPTPCYGDVVTLVCHHPEVVTDRSRYFSPIPTWTEDGVVITPADGTIYTTETVADLTRTLLNINITRDHFRNKSFKYSCELLLADENGRPSGEVETSGEVTVDPVGELLVHTNVYSYHLI